MPSLRNSTPKSVPSPAFCLLDAAIWLTCVLDNHPPRIQDLQRAREIYRACLKLVPHKKFTFAKVWVQFAEFEVRQQDLDAARKILGMAIGMCPKEKVRGNNSSIAAIARSLTYFSDFCVRDTQLFKDYVDLELRLREFDRCRIIYQKWLEVSAAFWWQPSLSFSRLRTSL